MEPINQEKFGAFIAQLRKEKGLTQQKLADRLLLSNKAVSKWERGQSLPDISLLTPLADILGVTVTELLRGQRLETPQLDAEEAESLVNRAIALSDDKGREKRRKSRRFWKLGWCVSAALTLIGTGLLRFAGVSWAGMGENVILVDGLCLLFGFWACFMAEETLPAYYDENRITAYSQGPFRMNLPGVRFHNGNWPHMARILRIWFLIAPAVFPVVYWFLRAAPAAFNLAVTLIAALGFFPLLIVTAKRYE